MVPSPSPSRLGSPATARSHFRLSALVRPSLRLGEATLLILIVALFLSGLGRADLIASHEARAAQHAAMMRSTGEVLLPTLYDGQVDLQKPPGYYWLAALASGLFGPVTPFTVRLPAALAGLVTVLAVWGYARRVDPVTGLLAAGALATAVHFTSLARTARIDMPLTAAVTVCLLSLNQGLTASGRRRWPALRFASLAATAAILLKGPIGIGLILATAIPLIPLQGWGWRRSLLILAGITTIASLLAAPWFLLANLKTDGQLVRVFFWHHNVARFLGNAPTLATHPWWYYLRFAADFLPWSLLLLPLALWALRQGLWRSDPLFRLGLVWFFAMLLLLSTSRFKRADYLLPAYPGAALAFAAAARAWDRTRQALPARSLGRVIVAVTFTLTVLAWPLYLLAIEPRLHASQQKQAFAQAIRHHAPQDTILLFRVESHLLAFHLGQPLHTLVEWGELNDWLSRPGRTFLVTQPGYAEEARSILPHHPLEVVCQLEDFTTAPPPRPLVLLRKRD